MQNLNSKRAAGSAALLLCAVVAAAAWIAVREPPASAGMRTGQLSIAPAAGGAAHMFNVEIAVTEHERELGLMFRTKLADSEGMLFTYGTAQDVSMWMRNTYIPLDMVFIRGDGAIHRIEMSAEPMSDRIINSNGPVSAVLELAGGATGRLGIKPGDHVNPAIFGAANKP